MAIPTAAICQPVEDLISSAPSVLHTADEKVAISHASMNFTKQFFLKCVNCLCCHVLRYLLVGPATYMQLVSTR